MIINVMEYLDNSEKKYSNKVAFNDFKKEVTFKELKNKSYRIASGITQFFKEPIAIYMNKSVECIETMYGVITSGNFYTIIDTKMPVDRVNKIMNTFQPKVIITLKEYCDKVKEFSNNIIFYEDLVASKINNKAINKIRNKSVDTDPIYTLFTSGSTGTPKGYTVNHRGVIDFVESMAETFNLSSKDVFGNQSPLYFDLSINDVFGTIKNGNTVYLIPQSYFMFPINIIKLLNENKINSIFWVPSALVLTAPALEKMCPKYLKRVMFCGEVMPNKQLNIWRKYLPNCLFANLYGPAETVDASTYYIVNRKFKDSDMLPIGRPFKNTKVYVISEDNKLVTKQETVGELCIGGSSLSMGYYNNKEKTQSSFVQNPVNDKYLEMIYKTGDLVKYNKYNELVFVSRKDYQIKHMGYRIELGEIESAISFVKGIKINACIYDDEKEKIVMFYSGDELDNASIVKELKKKLPNYMIPNVIIRMDTLPHNLNGKIDRKKLKEDYLKDRN